MLERYLVAILNALVILHQENKAIARGIIGDSTLDKSWDELFFAQLSDVVTKEEKETGKVKKDGKKEGQ